MTKKNLLAALAEDFASYLLSEGFVDRNNVRNVILYGSVARGDFTEKSDIDVFIDMPRTGHAAGIETKLAVDGFYTSIWFEKWKRFGIKNKISCIAGNIDKWKDLKRSIISNNILLYGRYRGKIDGRAMSLFTIENIKPASKRVFALRTIFGYTRYKKSYKGLLEKCGGERVSKGCFMVPLENSRHILDFLRREKIMFKLREISLAE